MTEHSCSTHDPTCWRCDLRRDEYLRQLEREVVELRADVAMLRHAADLQAETLAERDAEVQRLQALIDAWADSHRQALVLDPPDAAVKAWMRHTVNSSRLLKASTPKDDADGR